MAAEIKVEYNHLEAGPRVITWGEKPLLIYWSNVINDKKIMAYCAETEPGYWHQQSRQWFSNWVVEVYEWINGNMVKVHQDIFNPYAKKVHFILDEFDSIENHIEYVRACKKFISHWNLSTYAIESPYAHELKELYPDTTIAHKILDPENCYVNYVIKKTPSLNYSWENYKVWTKNVEYVLFNDHHPLNPEDQTPYEFAESILFGPDYSKLNHYIPYAWTLNEKVVS